MNTRYLFRRCTQYYARSFLHYNNLCQEHQLPGHFAHRKSLHISATSSAGHSHYENIRHIKSAIDGSRAKVFAGLAKRLSNAIKEGGGNDPKKNPELAQVLKLCKKKNMPRQTTEKLLNAKSVPGEEFTFALQGPGGSSIIVLFHSLALASAKQGLQKALNLSNMDGKLDQQCLSVFNKKRVIITDTGKVTDMNEDKATEIALAIDAEEVQLLPDEAGTLMQFTCDVGNHTKVERSIEDFDEGFAILSSKQEYLPNMHVELTDRDCTSVQIFFKALQKVSAKEEIRCTVSDVSHNISNIETFEFSSDS